MELNPAEGTEQFAFERPEHVQQPLIQAVVDKLLGGGKCPGTEETAARTNRVMDQLTRGLD